MAFGMHGRDGAGMGMRRRQGAWDVLMHSGAESNSKRSMKWLLFVAFMVLTATPGFASLPKRLVLALDGVAYRDMKALQEGVTSEKPNGEQVYRRAFHQGYFPVSRLISTFPSASDVAWTDILGDRPLPGYQRTYFCRSANQVVHLDGVASSMEYERQMTWQINGGFTRSMGYLFPSRAFDYEARELVKTFLNATNGCETFYALIRATDDAQHMSSDILAMLCALDQKLQELRSIYRDREGRELEIVILSDHGNNHAGPAKRIEIRAFLKEAGYHLTKSLLKPRDVVLPTCGMMSWVEIHNSPADTRNLAQVLAHLQGVDVLTAKDPDRPDQFIVMNSRNERAVIGWNRAGNSFRYSAEIGDPLDYLPVIESLSKKHLLDANGFATSDAWMTETIAHRYPLALERIVHAHTKAALNTATIIISLKNGYIHAGWLVKKGSDIVRLGGTHGGLDDLNSNGILLSNIAPTQDTSASRVAGLYGGFKRLRNYRAEETGAEWVCEKVQTMTTSARSPVDSGRKLPATNEVFLRIWASKLGRVSLSMPIDLTVCKARNSQPRSVRRWNYKPLDTAEAHFTLGRPIEVDDQNAFDRIYALPPDFILEPRTSYLITASLRDHKNSRAILTFAFLTDDRGIPAAY